MAEMDILYKRATEFDIGFSTVLAETYNASIYNVAVFFHTEDERHPGGIEWNISSNAEGENLRNRIKKDVLDELQKFPEQTDLDWDDLAETIEVRTAYAIGIKRPNLEPIHLTADEVRAHKA